MVWMIYRIIIYHTNTSINKTKPTTAIAIVCQPKLLTYLVLERGIWFFFYFLYLHGKFIIFICSSVPYRYTQSSFSAVFINNSNRPTIIRRFFVAFFIVFISCTIANLYIILAIVFTFR